MGGGVAVGGGGCWPGGAEQQYIEYLEEQCSSRNNK